MANTIKCPKCGTENPSTQKVCQRCQTPLTSEASFEPGQAPVQKDTGELENMLPQWLRDARESAKQDEPLPDEKTLRREEPPVHPADSNMDFLAVLQSQVDDEEEEEMPDWLASITGTTPKPKTKEPLPGSVPQAGTIGKDDLQKRDSSDGEDVPSWLTSLQPSQTGAEEKDEPGGWSQDSDGEEQSFQQSFEGTPRQTPAFDPSFSTPSSGEIPDWLKQISADTGEQTFETPTGDAFGSSDWFSQPPVDSNAAPQSQEFETFDLPSDTPDWLKQMSADAGEQTFEAPAGDSFGSSDWFSQPSADADAAPQSQEFETFDLPSDTSDWLNQQSADSGASSAQAQTSEPFGLPSDTPDWLDQLPKDPGTTAQAQPSEPFGSSFDTPDWLNQLSSDSGAAAQEQPAEAFTQPSDTPDWLNQLSSDLGTTAQAQTSEPSGISPDTPDWLSSLGGTSGGESAPFVESAPAESEPPAFGGELPSWLAPESEASKKVDSTPRWLQGEGEAGTATPAWLASNKKTVSSEQPEKPAEDDLFGGDVPDWLKSAAPQSSIFDQPADSATEPPKTQSTPAFADDAFPGQGNALFTEMPDWLSNAMESPPSTPVVPEPITGSDALAPDVLPSWVEAMRPMDQGMANIAALSGDQTLESRGALAGLHGVLPSGAGFNPTSKPKAHSIKLNASEEQLKHAAILEQVLAAETAPELLESEKPIGASKPLRWALSFILLVVAFITSFLHTQIFSMPLLPPNELKFAVAVEQAIPENSPVLVAVDYEPSRAGEMEAAAAPLFDNMLLLKHPQLTFIASNETGSVLAERFMAGTMAFHVNNGVTYQNLGYLSGGHMGIRAFAQDPGIAAPGVAPLNQFAVIIIITDSADAARAWVEQTQNVRGAVPILVVTSAQAAPMIQPYYDSGQVAGMVSGLYGGAIFEKQYNNGRPGIARNYWDAYSIGMFLAMLLVLGGGFVNMALGLRERSALKGTK